MTYENAVQPATDNQGKEGLLEELVRKYGRQVTHVCFGYTRNWDDAREMAQEAFIKAYKGLDGFEGRSQLKTWLTRIAINQCLTFLAMRGRERLGMLNFMYEQAEPHEEHPDKEESRIRVERLLADADPVTRKVLEKLKQGLNHSQIAVTLGVSRVAVTRRITRFKRKTARKLAYAL
jgi:RNA polymerase sigma factor (sigma-70 family)